MSQVYESTALTVPERGAMSRLPCAPCVAVTQSGRMILGNSRWMTGLALAIIWAGLTPGQGPKAENRQPIVETFTIYTEPPRLFLRPHSLRLLRRGWDRK